MIIVPTASLNLTPFGKVWGWVEGGLFGGGGGGGDVGRENMFSSCMGGGCSSIEVITFSSPSARK